ncbi:MAG: AI-2E family transporter [Candidatus Magasanikbacteria bacterium]|nr:AI-2E family transporter [Candidatus Magasanikbacteria bacterium]
MANGNKPQATINISTWSILRVFIILVGVYFLYQIRDVVLIVFAAILFSSMLEKPVDYLHQRKIPRAVSVVLIYLILIALVTFVTWALVPPIVEQIKQLGVVFPSYIQKSFSFFNTKFNFIDFQALQNFSSSLTTGTTTNLLNTIVSFFGGFVSTVVVLVMTFYLVVEQNALKRAVRSITPEKYHFYLEEAFEKLQTKLGNWLAGQLVLSLIIGVLVYAALSIIGVPYALVLAILAGLFEFVPYIGPITATIPAVLIALAQSPLKALLVIIVSVVIQQLENHILVPQIMRKAVGLNPVVSIVALMIGLKVGGIAGGVVAIPLAAALSVFVTDIYEGLKK